MDSNIVQDSERTIEEVYDKKTGNYIQSDVFFKQSEDVIMHWRRYLSEAALMNEPRLVCSHCYQMVKLSGRKTNRGKVVFFSHLYDSDDCDIKTSTNKTREEILAAKYGKISESERHYRLKNLLARYLSTIKSLESGITNVEIEKRINSNIPYLNYRRPDVSVVYKGKKLVFELQLSTTFLDVVVDRDIFYRLNNYFIIWVFNFDENQEYVNLRNLMMKDIYYANKRNIFVFDEEAQYLSAENGCLYLHCMWMQEDRSFSKGKFVTLDELSFDEETSKPFYFDADEVFYKIYPDRKDKIEELERSRQSILESLMRRMADTKLKEEKERDRVLLLEDKMKASGKEASIYSVIGEYGFKTDDEIITTAQFDEVKKVETGDYIVRKGENRGLVNKYGRIIVPCQFKEVEPIFNNTTIVLNKNKWILYERNEEITNSRRLDVIEIKDLDENLKLFVLHDGRKNAEPDKQFLFFKNSSFIEVNEITKESSVWKFNTPSSKKDYKEITTNGLIIEKRKNDKIIAKTADNIFGLINDKFEVLTSFSYGSMEFQGDNNLKVSLKDKYGYGIITYDEEIVFEIKYSDIGQLGENLFKIRDGFWKVVDKEGKVYFNKSSVRNIPVKDIVSQFGEYLIFRGFLEKYGIISLNGEIKVEPTYSGIMKWDVNPKYALVNRYWQNENSNWYGFIDENLKEKTRCNLRNIELNDNGLITARDYENVYIFNKDLDILFSSKGDTIEKYTQDYVIVETYGKSFGEWSYLKVYKFNPSGELLCKEKFKSVKDFVEDEAFVRSIREDKKIVEGKVDKNFKPLLCDISTLSNGDIKGTKFGRWGIQSRDGIIKIPFIYGEIIEKEDHFLVRKVVRNSWGYSKIDKITYSLLPDTKDQLDNGVYKIGFQGFYGIWDENNNELIPPIYREIKYLTNDLYVATVDGYDRVAIIDKNNNMLIDNYYVSVSLMNNGYIKFKDEVNRVTFMSRRIGGFISPDGRIIVYGDFEGNDFEDHRLLMKRSHGESWVTDKGEIENDEEIILDNGTVKFRQFGLYGIKYKDGKILLPCKFMSIVYCSDLDIYVTSEGYANKTKFWDKDFNVIKESETGEKILSYVGKGLFIIENTKKEQGVINTAWEYIISCAYNDIEIHGNYFILSKIKVIVGRWNYNEIKLYGVYTLDGLCVGDCTYRKVEPIGDKLWRLWYGENKDSYEIKTFRGTVLRAQKIWQLNKEYYIIEWYGKKGVIDKDLSTIVPVEYQDIKFENNQFIVLDGLKWINYKTDEIVEEIKTFVEGIQYKGKITNFQKYGFFVKVGGIGSGLVHISEIQNHFRRLKDFKKNQEVTVKVKSFKDGKPNFTLC